MNLSKLWEIVKDGKAWHAVVHVVTESRTWLSYWVTEQQQYSTKSTLSSLWLPFHSYVSTLTQCFLISLLNCHNSFPVMSLILYSCTFSNIATTELNFLWFFLKTFLWYGPFLKSILLQYSFCSMFWVFGHEDVEYQLPNHGSTPYPLHWKAKSRKVLRIKLSYTGILGFPGGTSDKAPAGQCRRH